MFETVVIIAATTLSGAILLIFKRVKKVQFNVNFTDVKPTESAPSDN